MEQQQQKPDLKLVKTPEEMQKAAAEKAANVEFITKKIAEFSQKQVHDFGLAVTEYIQKEMPNATDTEKANALVFLTIEPFAIVMSSQLQLTGNDEADYMLAAMQVSKFMPIIADVSLACARDRAGIKPKN